MWDLTRNDVVISWDVLFIEGKPVEQTPAIYIEEPKIMYDSIAVLSEPPAETDEPQQLPTPEPLEHLDPEEYEQGPVDSQILLQESTMSNKGQATGGSTSSVT